MNNKAISSAVWYTIANFLVKGLNFFTIPLFTRMLTQAEYGEYNNFLSLLTIMNIVVSMSLESTIISARKDFRDALDGYTFSIMILGLTSGVIWLVVVQFFASAFSELFSVSPRYLSAMSLYLVFFPVTTTFQAWERFRFRYKGTVLVSIILAVGIAALSVGFAYLLPVPLDGVIFGRVLPAILVGAVILLRLAAKVRRVELSYWRYALRIAWPFIPHLLSMTLLGSIDRIFITRMCGAEADALYSLAYNVGLIVSIFVTSLNSAFSPWLGDRLFEEDYATIRRVSRPYITLFSVFALLVTLAAPEILFVLGGESYMPAVYAIPPVALGCVFQFAYSMYVNVEQYEKKTVGMALASVSAAALNIVLNLVLIPRFGYLAAAYTTLAGYVWLLVIHMLLVKRIGLLRVYDTRFILLTMAVSTVLMLGCAALYGCASIRCAVIIALFVLAAIFAGKRKEALVRLIKRS